MPQIPPSWRDGPAARLGVLLLLTDAGFILLHAVYAGTGLLPNASHSLEADGGFAETFQYVQWFWLAALLLGVGVARRSPRYAAWAALFAYLLADDSLGVHERVGLRLGGLLPVAPPFGLLPKDLGELAVSAAAGAVLLGLVAAAVVRSPPAFRALSRDLVGLVAALAVFGVAVDLLHAAVAHGTGGLVLATVEDGGEMVVASLMVRRAFAESLAPGPSGERPAAAAVA